MIKRNIIFLLAVIIALTSVYSAEDNKINCGVLSLWNCSRILGRNVNLQELNEKFGKKKEVSFYEIFSIAKELGFEVKAVRVKFNELSALNSPAIAWVEKDHFVTIDKVANNKAIVIDGMNDPAEFAEEEFGKICNGEILIISNPPDKSSMNTSPLAFSGLMYNFGTIETDFETSYTFTMKNNTDKTVIITNVEKNCSCFEIEIQTKEIKPGEYADIIAYMHYAETYGAQKSLASVQTNLEGYEKIDLQITANIEPRFVVSPLKVNLGKVVPNTAKPFEVFIISKKKSKNSIVSIESDSADIKCELQDVPLSGEPVSKDANDFSRWKIAAVYKSGNEAGIVKSRIKILTDDKEMPEIEIPVESEALPKYTVYPANLFFGFQDKNKKLNQSLTVRSLNNEKFTIKEVNLENTPFEAKFDKETASDECRIDFSLNASEDKKIINSNIRIEISSRTDEKISLSVPVFAVIR